jgi:hypothetical protein
VALATRGQRDMDTGLEAIADPEERTTIRRQARNVHIQSLVLATVLVALVLVVPSSR